MTKELLFMLLRSLSKFAELGLSYSDKGKNYPLLVRIKHIRKAREAYLALINAYPGGKVEVTEVDAEVILAKALDHFDAQENLSTPNWVHDARILLNKKSTVAKA